MEVEEVLKEAEKYMEFHEKSNFTTREEWYMYDLFKHIATDSGKKWLKNYDEFISKLTKILKL